MERIHEKEVIACGEQKQEVKAKDLKEKVEIKAKI